MKLKPEVLDELRELLNHSALKYVFAEIDSLAEEIESDIIALQLDSSTDRELILRKARAEGARRLALAIQRRFNSLKSASE